MTEQRWPARVCRSRCVRVTLLGVEHAAHSQFSFFIFCISACSAFGFSAAAAAGAGRGSSHAPHLSALSWKEKGERERGSEQRAKRFAMGIGHARLCAMRAVR